MPRRPSEVWLHFSRIEDRPDSAKCNLCGNVYKRGGGTKNLLDHLQRAHSGVLRAGAVAPHNANGEFYDENNPKKKDLDTWLLRLFAKDYQPFHMVEDDGFVKLVQAMDPRYKLPCRQTISNKMIPNLYEEVKVKVKADIATAKNVALTSDAWTSKSQDSYLAITAHYIFNGELKSACLDCGVLPGPHSALNISERIRQIINEWHLTKKVCAVVTDNGANMVAAVRLLGLRHLACSAHTLNLVVKDAISSSTEISELLERCSAIVTFFKHSNIAIDKLKSKRAATGKTPLGVVQQVATRWNSTLGMIRRLIELREEVILCLSELRNGPRTLDGGDWNTLQEIEDILKPFEEMTKTLSGEKYVTASLIIPHSHGLIHKLNEIDRSTMSPNAVEFLKSIIEVAKDRLLNYEQRTVSRNATFVNPHFKKAAFVSANRAEDARASIEEEVRGILQRAQGAAAANATITSSQYNGLLSFLNERADARRHATTSTADASILLRQYVEMRPIDNKVDPIAYWSTVDSQHNALAEVANYYLCVPATSVPAERLFSKAGYLITERRNALSPGKAKMLIFLHANVSFF